MNDNFNIVLLGVGEGQERKEAATKLATLFKQDIQKIEALLLKPAIIKRNVDYVTAMKYKEAIEQCGALCEIHTETPIIDIKPVVNTITEQDSDKKADYSNAPSNHAAVDASKKTSRNEDNQTSIVSVLKRAGEDILPILQQKVTVLQSGLRNAVGSKQDTENQEKIRTEKSDDNQDAALPPKVSLWNPNAATMWSLVFTPLFGAWIHAKNWTALGDNEKVAKSMYWAYGAIAILVLNLFTTKGVAWLSLVYLLVWNFILGKQQIKYVKEKYGDTYDKKSWVKPIGIGVGAFLVYILIIVFFEGIMNGMPSGDGTDSKVSAANHEKASQPSPAIAKKIGVQWKYSETKDPMTDERKLISRASFQNDTQLRIDVEFVCNQATKELGATATGYDTKNKGISFIQREKSVELPVRLNEEPSITTSTKITNYSNQVAIEDISLAKCYNTNYNTIGPLLLPLVMLQVGDIKSQLSDGRRIDTEMEKTITKLLAEYPNADCLFTPAANAWLELTELRVQFPLVAGNVVARIAPHEPNLRKALEACAGP
jgi:hypothetical protein